MAPCGVNPHNWAPGQNFFKKVLTNIKSYVIIRIQKRKEKIDMTYFLFYDGVMGEHFVIEGDDNWVAEDAYEEARNVVDVEDELEYLGIVSDEEVDAMGYDVY
jgi:hypothetical protein